MFQRSGGRRRGRIGHLTAKGRRRSLLVTVILAVAGLGVFMISNALAVHDLKFELDGNVATEGHTGFSTNTFDWASFFDASGNKSPVLPAASRPGFTASAFDRDFLTNPNGSFNTSDATTYATGSKDTLPITPGWQCNFNSNVNSKIDIMNAYSVAYTDPVSGHQILYFALERNANTGDGNVGFWFLQDDVGCSAPTGGSTAFTGSHQDGDLLMVSAFTKGGGVSTIDVYRWVGGANGALNPNPVAHGVDCITTAGSDAVCATTNGSPAPGINGPITTPWLTSTKTGGPGHTVESSEFFEGGLDLTQSNLGGHCFNVFIGDTRSSQSLTATLFDFARGALGECNSTTVTTPKKADGTTNITSEEIPALGTLAVKDSALVTVTGIPSFSGTVSFHLCGPATASSTTTCDTGGVAIGSPQAVTSSPATVTSDSATITSAGRYCWRADFSGDTTAGVPASSDHSSGECFLVTPKTPTLTTQAGAGPVDFGSAVTDTATLSGTANEPGSGGPTGSNGTINPVTAGSAAKGSITFTLYKNDCTTVATGTGSNPQTVTTVSGDNTYPTSGSVSFTPDAPGTYHWVATYTGDLPNTTAPAAYTCGSDTNEDVVVQQIPTQIKTKQSWFPNDTATITATTGNLAAGGTVAFKLYDTGTCAGTAKYSESKTLTGGNATEEVSTNNTTFNITTLYADPADSSTGVFSWKVVYTPAAADTAHTGKQSSCDAEHFGIQYTNDAGPGSNLP
jgi:hypothetical protein